MKKENKKDFEPVASRHDLSLDVAIASHFKSELDETINRNIVVKSVMSKIREIECERKRRERRSSLLSLIFGGFILCLMIGSTPFVFNQPLSSVVIEFGLLTAKIPIQEFKPAVSFLLAMGGVLFADYCWRFFRKEDQ